MLIFPLPLEGLPSVKKYNAMAKVFDPIKAAGQKGDVSKAKDAYEKVSFCYIQSINESSNSILKHAPL